ncbi:multicopper oxidase family protein [Marinilabilia salmonicolor]|uniref:multicopper oxidase family protein n=1 Tax=Marinilabilia salmonicolor TaxID=989 RepID=UPI00029A47A6|nr:multicopper oxidase family protein [Marinilabilia salmonicolor]
MKNFTSTKLIFLLLIATGLSACNAQGKSNAQNGSGNASSDFSPDIEIELTAQPVAMQLLDGPKTNIFQYEARLLKGNDSNLSEIQGSYLGPIIRVKHGQKIRVIFKNNLPSESIIHWHGLHIPPEMDGHPMHAVDNGEQYVYEFTVVDRPGTYWFHPHPDKITGPQVYRGLAGLFIIEDEKKQLPSGAYDQPLVIQDRSFDSDNQLIYLEGSPMQRMQGFLGDQIFINGQKKLTQDVNKGTYRFRILNGSNARIYKLAWSDDSDIKVIATDGGLLEKPLNKPYLMLAPGERVEIWKNFSACNSGEKITLESLTFNSGTSMGRMGSGGMMGNMGGGMMGGNSSSENGEAMPLYTFNVTGDKGKSLELPQTLSKIEEIAAVDAINYDSPKQFHFYHERMNWVINGETFEMEEVADWEKVKLNTTEVWQFINGDDGSGMGMMQDMMQLPHPAHIHGLQFQIIERDISEMNADVWNSVKDGFIDKGWQDTFLLMPGMKVKVVMSFRDFTGKYIYHCHNLEHEDMGMMRNYEVLP